MRRLHLLVPISLFAAVGLASPASAGGPPPDRFASPHGTGTACTAAAPCKIVTAVNQAPGGNRVVIEPGRYGSAKAPIAAGLTDASASGGLTITGQVGSPNPVIVSSADQGIYLSETGSTVSHLTLITSGADNGLVLFNASGDHLVVRSSGGNYGACEVYGQLTDSVCTTSAADSQAVEADNNASFAPTLRGVTAEATGKRGIGLVAQENGPGTITFTVTNSIIHGAGSDVQASTEEADGTASVTLSHTDYHTKKLVGPGSTSVNRGATDLRASPKFANAASGNFTEKAGSPTINAGAADPAKDTDVLGNPRTLGSAPDMGAYEFLQKPTASALKVNATTKHVAHLTVKVNPEGLATKVKLIARLGHHHLISHVISAGHGTAGRTIHLTLHGLQSGTGYRVDAVATNRAGHTSSSTKRLHTRR